MAFLFTYRGREDLPQTLGHDNCRPTVLIVGDGDLSYIREFQARNFVKCYLWMAEPSEEALMEKYSAEQNVIRERLAKLAEYGVQPQWNIDFFNPPSSPAEIDFVVWHYAYPESGNGDGPNFGNEMKKYFEVAHRRLSENGSVVMATESKTAKKFNFEGIAKEVGFESALSLPFSKTLWFSSGYRSRYSNGAAAAHLTEESKKSHTKLLVFPKNNTKVQVPHCNPHVNSSPSHKMSGSSRRNKSAGEAVLDRMRDETKELGKIREEIGGYSQTLKEKFTGAVNRIAGKDIFGIATPHRLSLNAEPSNSSSSSSSSGNNQQEKQESPPQPPQNVVQGVADQAGSNENKGVSDVSGEQKSAAEDQSTESGKQTSLEVAADGEPDAKRPRMQEYSNSETSWI